MLAANQAIFREDMQAQPGATYANGYDALKASFDVLKDWGASPAPLVTVEQYAQRHAACLSCGLFLHGFCGACKCFLPVKLMLEKAECPHPDGTRW